MTVEEIVSSLWKTLADGYDETAVRWPGMRFDTDAHNEWIAPDILAVPRDPERKNSTRFQVRFQVAMFVKADVNIYRVQEVEDAVRAIFDQARIVVRNYDAGGTPQTGMLQAAEGQTADLGDDVLRAELRHSVLTFDAWADSTN